MEHSTFCNSHSYNFSIAQNTENSITFSKSLFNYLLNLHEQYFLTIIVLEILARTEREDQRIAVKLIFDFNPDPQLLDKITYFSINRWFNISFADPN